jgi:hypothetical protein
VSGYLLEDGSGVLLLEDSSGIYLLDVDTGVAGRVLVAFDDPALEPTPTWTRIDNNTAFRVSDISIRRGRQTEFDQTETSTATVTVKDPSGVFDPNNMSSPYFGNLNGKQIMLQLQNPVTGVWHTQFRGHIDDYGYDLSETMVLSTVQIECVDLFDYLARVEMVIGLFGDPALSVGGSAGVVVYAETDFQTRLVQAATDAGLPPEFFVFFTGNVDVQETKYDPGDPVMMVMRDAVDAEFPTAANIYTDKAGRVVGHGRYARFTPEDVAATGDWTFTRWDAATGGAVISGVAQIRAAAQVRQSAVAGRQCRDRVSARNRRSRHPRTDRHRHHVMGRVRIRIMVSHRSHHARRHHDRQHREPGNEAVRLLHGRELQATAATGGGVDVQKH